MLLSALVFSRVKNKVRSGDRDSAVALARRWRRIAPRSALAVYTEYWALTGDRQFEPGEHIDLLRRAYALAPVSTASTHLVDQLIQMFAKWGQEQYAEEAERIINETINLRGENQWALACRADLAFLRGDYERERTLRAHRWEIHPKPDHPQALMERAVELVDDGDRESAVTMLKRASSSRNAKPLAHMYLAALVEETDPATAAVAEANARRLWRDSNQSFDRELQWVRRRLREGKFADARPRH
jgi:predicted Zn-dependent protease